MASSGPSSRKLPRTDKKPAPSSSSSNYSATFDDDFFRRRKRREQQESGGGGGGGGGGGIAPAKPRSPVKPRSPKKVPTPPAPRRPATSRRPVAPPSPPPPPPSLSSPPRSRPLSSSSSSTAARSPKKTALVEQLPAPLADLVFGGLSDDELASLVRRANRPYEYVGYSTQSGSDEKKPGARPSSSSSSATRTVAEFRPRPYAPSSPRLSDDLNRSFESLRIRCRSTCAQQWRQVVAKRLRETLRRMTGRAPGSTETRSENKGESGLEGERNQEEEELDLSAPLPICARLCAADTEPVLELVRAYRDELRALVASGEAHASDRTAHGVTYATSNAWELGYEPFLRFRSSAQNAFGVRFDIGVELRAETDTRRPEPERLRLIVDADFTRPRFETDVWDATEWSSGLERETVVDTAESRNAAEKRIVARRALNIFVADDVARTADDAPGGDAVDFVATRSDRYEWTGPDNGRTWREFARVIAIVQWAATPDALYVAPSPQDWEGAHVPSPLPRYLRLVRAAFPETPVVVQYRDNPTAVMQREPHGYKHGRVRLKVPGDHIARLVAAANVPGVVAQLVREVWRED